MSDSKYLDILFPVGRLVGGDLYNPETKDFDGNPLVYKTGDKAGQPRVEYFLAVASPKTPGVTRWQDEVSANPRIGPWGKRIADHAKAYWPGGQSDRRDFAWKIVDGDSTEVNKKGRRWCDIEGYPGHWVLRFGGSEQPKIVNADGSQYLHEPGVVKRGHFVQMYGSCSPNGNQNNPGMYLNHKTVAHSGYGPEITSGPDPSEIGFGGALPPGASAVPVTTMAPPPAPAAAAPLPPAPPPATGFVAGAIGAPPPPTVPAGPVMTPAANGVPYEKYIEAGWKDEQLRAAGLML